MFTNGKDFCVSLLYLAVLLKLVLREILGAVTVDTLCQCKLKSFLNRQSRPFVNTLFCVTGGSTDFVCGVSALGGG